MQRQHSIEYFQSVAIANPDLYWFAIADSAQDMTLPEALGRPSRSLFDAEPGSPLAEKSPHLVELSSPVEGGACWKWIARYDGATPSITIIASQFSFSPLFSRLRDCAEVVLPDGEGMFFAFWDPAILGTLVGQNDDNTLHVPGPVLTLEQQAAFAAVIHMWWYWDRTGGLHTIEFPRRVQATSSTPIHLNQEQVDALVEASLPDHLLYFVKLNQPHLLHDIEQSQQYRIVCAALQSARQIGLEQMRDLVNYICVMLFYKGEMLQNQAILELLDRVRTEEISFDDAMQLFP